MITLKYYIQWSKVRNFCVKYDLYTCGDNSEYMHMLIDMCDVGATTLDQIELIAENIVAHSDKATLDYNTFDAKGWVMQEILNDCTFIMVDTE